GDFRAAAGRGAERDRAAGSAAGSRGDGEVPGGAGSHTDGGGAVADAGAIGAGAGSGGAGTGVEAVAVERRVADVGVGGAVPEGVSEGEAVEHLRVVGGGGGRELLRGEGRGRRGRGDGTDRQAERQHADI